VVLDSALPIGTKSTGCVRIGVYCCLSGTSSRLTRGCAGHAVTHSKVLCSLWSSFLNRSKLRRRHHVSINLKQHKTNFQLYNTTVIQKRSVGNNRKRDWSWWYLFYEVSSKSFILRKKKKCDADNREELQ